MPPVGLKLPSQSTETITRPSGSGTRTRAAHFSNLPMMHFRSGSYMAQVRSKGIAFITDRELMVAMNLESLLVSLIIGIVAGWLAGEVWRGYGFGLVGNLIVGVVGALLGGWLFSVLGLALGGVVGALVTSFIGALILLFIVNMIARSTGKYA